jgi:hypothetical protein
MYAVFTEVNADESQIEAGREFLPQRAAPMARERGAKGGYWLAPRTVVASPLWFSRPKRKRARQPGCSV